MLKLDLLHSDVPCSDFNDFSSFHFVLLQIRNKQIGEALATGGEKGLKEYIKSKMWYPEYRPFVYLPPGRLE